MCLINCLWTGIKDKWKIICLRGYVRAKLHSALFSCNWSDCSKAGGTGMALGGAGAVQGCWQDSGAKLLVPVTQQYSQ